ncbi:MAG: carboxypeptidase-like regulatory domain-containing protein, partial [Deltaproteobacteria bacterium]|nr:carboxypeptidase-like regulatory domain-containing protein [Deltaproteobacteria bacterium]
MPRKLIMAYMSKICGKPFLARLLIFLLFAICLSACGDSGTSADDRSDFNGVAGMVLDENGPVAGATVRIQGTDTFTMSDENGAFTLEDLPADTVTVSAWKDKYYAAKVEGVNRSAVGLSLYLRLYQTNDNPAYTWTPPVGENSCAACKKPITD